MTGSITFTPATYAAKAWAGQVELAANQHIYVQVWTRTVSALSSITRTVSLTMGDSSLGAGTLGGLNSKVTHGAAVDVAADGSGVVALTKNVTAGGTVAQTVCGAVNASLCFTYTAPAGGIKAGSVAVTVPAGWTAPNTTAGTAGYSTASAGTLTVAGRTIQVDGVTLAAAGTMTIAYGSGASGTATASQTAGAPTWTAQDRSTPAGTLTTLGSQPTVTVDPGPLDHFVFAAASPQTDGLAFTGTNTLTAQDVYNNVITTFDPSVNNVTITAVAPFTARSAGCTASATSSTSRPTSPPVLRT